MNSTYLQLSTNQVKYVMPRWVKSPIKRVLEYLKNRSTQSYWMLFKLIYQLPTAEISDFVETYHRNLTPILDDVGLPPHISYLFAEDCDDLNSMLNIGIALDPKIVVELGTAHGNATANICKVCENVRIYSVNALDTDQTGDMVTFELTADEIGRVYKNHGYSDRVTQILKNTLDLNLKEYINEQSVDLAIIDACHDTDYVIHDFFKVLPFIKPNGIVLFHDTHPSMQKHLAGSYGACMKLRKCGFDIYHLKDTWWGIWKNVALDLSHSQPQID